MYTLRKWIMSGYFRRYNGKLSNWILQCIKSKLKIFVVFIYSNFDIYKFQFQWIFLFGYFGSWIVFFISKRYITEHSFTILFLINVLKIWTKNHQKNRSTHLAIFQSTHYINRHTRNSTKLNIKSISAFYSMKAVGLSLLLSNFLLS